MIREITPQDKERVLAISRNIWDGEDYIADVFDDWVKDARGLFCGLWENGKLVGFGKLTYLSEYDIWLEGLRKDESCGVKGVGEKLSRQYINYLKGKKIRSVRFSTYFGNIASITLNEKLGFKCIHTLSLKSKPITKKIEYSDEWPVDFDLKAIHDYIMTSSYLHGTKGFIGRGWVVYEYNLILLNEFYKHNKIIVYSQNNEIKGCAIWDIKHQRDIIWICFLEAENDEILQKLLTRINNIGFEGQQKEMQILVPDGKLLEFCKNNNFTSWEQDHDFLLYELPQQVLKHITNPEC